MAPGAAVCRSAAQFTAGCTRAAAVAATPPGSSGNRGTHSVTQCDALSCLECPNGEDCEDIGPGQRAFGGILTGPFHLLRVEQRARHEYAVHVSRRAPRASCRTY